MKDYNTLKGEIQRYIRTNNNQEITGEVLQSVLISIVSNVGENAGFSGIAKKTTSPGTPDGPVFYFATEQGVYPNFGGLEIEKENTLNIIYNTEDGWGTLYLGNLVPNEEVKDFQAFKNLEGMNFYEASAYCATFDNIIEKLDGGAIRFSRPSLFTFSGAGADQGIIINSASSGGIITQYAFTKATINKGGFSRRIIQYDMRNLTITNVGEWLPISGLIPAATTSAAGLMSADDKKKLDIYPAQFVMDFGLVDSQAAGEQMAAASEVAGNRNISFIRFQVQGVSTLKTTLIMQWPNGINETAQIMCVDKAQWRRNVTGATGVKGAPTNAFQWERTAPHYIGYDTARRMIQLKDYQQIVSREVELPLATSAQHGLMSSTDKKALDNAAEKADTALRMMPFDGVFGNPTIETQGVSSYDAIIFDDIRCMFLARKNNKFYMSFIGIEDYNAITSGTMKARTDRIFFRTDTKRTYIFNGAALSNLSISDEEAAKLANYPNSPLEIPIATENSQGLMSASDKASLGAAIADIVALENRIAALEAQLSSSTQ